MNKVVSICGLILCSSFGISLKAKADPTWSNWATCPAGTWAVGFAASKNTFSLNTGFINGLRLECADLDRSLASLSTLDPLPGQGSMDWDSSSQFTGKPLDFLVAVELYFASFGFESMGTGGVTFVSTGGNRLERRYNSYNHSTTLGSCGAGEAINGLMVKSDVDNLRWLKITCSSYQSAIDAKNAAAADLIRSNRLNTLRQYVDLEKISVENDIKSASINKISFETFNSNISGAACAIAEVSTNGFSTQSDVDSYVNLFSKTFGHSDWQSNALSCDVAAQSIASYTGCAEGSLDPICLNRTGYLEIKSRLKNKLGDYAKYRDEANAIGERSVCESIERLSQKALIDVGSDISSKIASGALSGTCTGS